MTTLLQLLRSARRRLQLWQQERLFDAWRNEWRERRGY
jgi:hypothetical protein